MDVQKRNHVIKKVFITVLCLFDVDAWHLMFKPEKFDVEMIEPVASLIRKSLLVSSC